MNSVHSQRVPCARSSVSYQLVPRAAHKHMHTHARTHAHLPSAPHALLWPLQQALAELQVARLYAPHAVLLILLASPAHRALAASLLAVTLHGSAAAPRTPNIRAASISCCTHMQSCTSTLRRRTRPHCASRHRGMMGHAFRLAAVAMTIMAMHFLCDQGSSKFFQTGSSSHDHHGNAFFV